MHAHFTHCQVKHNELWMLIYSMSAHTFWVVNCIIYKPSEYRNCFKYGNLMYISCKCYCKWYEWKLAHFSVNVTWWALWTRLPWSLAHCEHQNTWWTHCSTDDGILRKPFLCVQRGGIKIMFEWGGWQTYMDKSLETLHLSSHSVCSSKVICHFRLFYVDSVIFHKILKQMIERLERKLFCKVAFHL